MKGTLYIVATPIGNSADITIRAINILSSVSFIICEEFKEARRFLSGHKIEKELISLNEHNERESSEIIIPRLLENESAALISDCGTPLFSDPGHYLLNLCIDNNIKVVTIPGASSLIPAITGSGLHIEKFYYFGWLPQKKDERIKELHRLKGINEAIVLMDTPYRLKTLISEINKVFSTLTEIVIAFELTRERERFLRGSAAKLFEIIGKENLKGEFVLIIDNRNNRKKHNRIEKFR